MRVHPLLAGEIEISRHFSKHPKGPLGQQRGMVLQLLRRGNRLAPVPAFLLEHPERGPIMVDTGYAADVAANPTRTLGFASGRLLFKHHPGDLDALLAERGVRASDVGLVVMTHFHSDHASGLERFAHTTIAADRVEWNAVEHGAAYHKPVIRAVKRRQLLDYEDPSAGRLGAFTLPTLDLFGDGSVTLISTRGHSAGHQSLLVRCASGRRVLLLGDAAHLMEQIDDPVPQAYLHDAGQFQETLAIVRAWLTENADVTVIPGHDPEIWPTLEAVYE
jgi:glyoxylase-like metal-dependent hydrolase (beta-lactamase superfamily II)